MRRVFRFVWAAMMLLGSWAAPPPRTEAANLDAYGVSTPLGVPTLSALSPSTVAAGSPAFTLTANGSGFVSGSIVRWNGSDRPTTFLSSTQLNALISAADVVSGGPFAVTVATPGPGGGISSPLNLTLYVRAGQDATADLELGQPDFISNTGNNALMPGGANQIHGPNGAAVDTRTAGCLWLTNRITACSVGQTSRRLRMGRRRT